VKKKFGHVSKEDRKIEKLKLYNKYNRDVIIIKEKSYGEGVLEYMKDKNR